MKQPDLVLSDAEKKELAEFIATLPEKRRDVLPEDLKKRNLPMRVLKGEAIADALQELVSDIRYELLMTESLSHMTARLDALEDLAFSNATSFAFIKLLLPGGSDAKSD